MKAYLSGLILFCALCSYPVQGLKASDLVARSPFLPKQNKIKSESVIDKVREVDNGRFILKGITRMGGTYLFSIYDSKTSKSKWISPGVNLNGFVISAYDPNTKTIDCSWGGRKLSIELEIANDAPLELRLFNENNPNSTPKTASGFNPESNSTGSGSSLRSVASAISNDLNQQREPRGKIIFERISALGGTYRNAYPNGDDGFKSEELFASDETSEDRVDQGNELEEPTDAPPPQRFKVKRRNNVHNANGKKPDHMPLETWLALKEKESNN